MPSLIKSEWGWPMAKKNFEGWQLSFGSGQTWGLVPYSQFVFDSSVERRLSPSMHSSTHLIHFPFLNKRLGTSPFSPLQSCTSDHLHSSTCQYKLSMQAAYTWIFRAMYLSLQHLKGIEHSMTGTSLRISTVSHSQNPLIRQYIDLSTVGLAKCVVSWDSGSFSSYTLDGRR